MSHTELYTHCHNAHWLLIATIVALEYISIDYTNLFISIIIHTV